MNLEEGIQVDDGFPWRVTLTSLVFGVVFYLFLVRVAGWEPGLSYALGAAVGVYTFDVFRMGGRVFLRTKEMAQAEPFPLWKKFVVGGLFLMKLPIWGISIYLAGTGSTAGILLFVCGIATPHFVMMTKVLSRMIVPDENPLPDNENSADPSVKKVSTGID